MAISALATAGLKAGAAIGGGILQYSQNKKLADRQYKQQLDMWNKMNEYNAPVQQMARFKEAGLNPNLIYGQGTPGNATQMAKYQEQATDFQGAADQVGDAASNYFDTRLKQGQIDNQLKDLDVKEASIRATLAGAGLKEFDRQLKEDTRADMIRSSKAKADQAEQQLKISYQQEQNIRTEGKIAKQRLQQQFDQTTMQRLDLKVKQSLQRAKEQGLETGLWGGAAIWKLMESIENPLEKTIEFFVNYMKNQVTGFNTRKDY